MEDQFDKNELYLVVGKHVVREERLAVELEELRVQRDDIISKFTELQDSNSRLYNDFQGLVDERDQLNRENKDLLNRGYKDDPRVSELELELEIKDKQVNALCSELARLKDNRDQLNDALLSGEKARSKLKDQSDTRAHKIIELNSQLGVVSQERDDLQDEVLRVNDLLAEAANDAAEPDRDKMTSDEALGNQPTPRSK